MSSGAGVCTNGCATGSGAEDVNKTIADVTCKNPPQLEFLFKDLNIFIKNKQILNSVSGVVHSGEVLAVMGPSGSGKTTMLSALAGRVSVQSGMITLDGNPLTKTLRKRTCYVLQEDIFLPKLTLWETLYFSAMVHLPEKMPHSEKMAKIDHIIKVLDLTKCRDTVVGDHFNRGLSGGEKKRLSIACELITDPDIMLLDEPTSGLDSSTAYSLMVLLKQLTENFGKAVVVTIHQPSSQMFHMFTHLLLLADGHIAYFGDGGKVLDFFEELGLVCEPHFNPADFVLETVKKDEETVKRIIDLAEAKRCTDTWPQKLRHNHHDHGAEFLSDKDKVISGSVFLYTDASGDVIVTMAESDVEMQKSVNSDIDGLSGLAENALLLKKSSDLQTKSSASSRWATGFWTQYKMLNWRTFKQSRSRIISKYNIVNSMSVAIVLGLLWFQIERTHETIKERMGYLFFMSTYWSFMPMFDALTSFPPERPVVRKERAAGAYRLSAFYFAKMSSELPLIFVMPSLFITITYWMGGFRGVSQYFATWAILVLNVLNCQGFGYIMGSAIWDLQMCITMTSVVVLFGLLSAGYYITRLPTWLFWVRYLSIVCYPYNAMSILELGDLPPVPCANLTSFDLPECHLGNSTIITADMVLKHFGVTLPIFCYIVMIVIQLFVFRSIAYFVMRFKNKPI
ncbi:ABC transporter G family member 21-like isoform X1 [Pomacea canaliculata]|uniref:ABC transporter G family member 21-like isoform X1 n=2 Tax=Pomacea canaliculata TaxID=400727 RepID=UPI000D729945|nr:ABC transporter G family member 21-like isoform X1 [Pomacea canaliculata]XP_025089508.1 ABC transporter G family member 21-like isoform X1 [Pomacea canaliculata]XP_025089509.1 ABC transporter G family member 21-like isoform X1 [Pomacea canaliculata]